MLYMEMYSLVVKNELRCLNKTFQYSALQVLVNFLNRIFASDDVLFSGSFSLKVTYGGTVKCVQNIKKKLQEYYDFFL
jgi:hypothetical protein